MTGTVYLIHFDEPIAHAQHYMGWTSDLEQRLDAHSNGTGSKLMAEVRRRGIPWSVTRTWEGVDRHFERKLKNHKSGPRFCPRCKEHHA